MTISQSKLLFSIIIAVVNSGIMRVIYMSFTSKTKKGNAYIIIYLYMSHQ